MMAKSLRGCGKQLRRFYEFYAPKRSFQFKRTASQQRRNNSTTTSSQKLSFLTENQKQQFENEGYVVVKDVFDKEHIQRMKNALDECEERAKFMTKSTNHFSLDPHHTLENPMLQRVHIISSLFPIFEETIRNERMLDVVQDLIGPDVRYVKQDKVNLKVPKGTRFPVKWHQDWAFHPYTNHNMVITSISIDDSTKENGE